MLIRFGVVVGAVLVAYGLYELARPWATIVVGLFVFLFSLGAELAARDPDAPGRARGQ